MVTDSFTLGSVGHTLTLMSGVWHDHVEIYDLTGKPLAYDEHGGKAGPAPYDNLVYIDFDGETYKQTNVTFKGRPLFVRSFAGTLVDGVLVFHKLGPEAPEHIGVSGGVGSLIFAPRAVDEAWQRYSEPDYVQLFGASERTRTTILYRNGVAVRTLKASGLKVAPVAERRLTWDPRGADGPVHESLPSETLVFQNPERRHLHPP